MFSLQLTRKILLLHFKHIHKYMHESLLITCPLNHACYIFFDEPIHGRFPLLSFTHRTQFGSPLRHFESSRKYVTDCIPIGLLVIQILREEVFINYTIRGPMCCGLDTGTRDMYMQDAVAPTAWSKMSITSANDDKATCLRKKNSCGRKAIVTLVTIW